MSNEPRSSDVQKDVEESRSRVDHTLSEIEDKFSPERLVNRGMGYMRANSDEIAQFGRNLGRTVRDHPIPVLLTGIGLASLAMASARGGPARFQGRGDGSYMDDEGGYRSQAWSSEASFYRDDEDGGGLSERAHAVADRARSAGRRAREGYRSAKERASHGYEQAGSMISNAFDRQPLACAAVAAAIGVTAAVLLPATRREDALMGRYRDNLRDEAKDKIEKGTRQAKEAVQGSGGDDYGSDV